MVEDWDIHKFSLTENWTQICKTTALRFEATSLTLIYESRTPVDLGKP